MAKRAPWRNGIARWLHALLSLSRQIVVTVAQRTISLRGLQNANFSMAAALAVGYLKFDDELWRPMLVVSVVGLASAAVELIVSAFHSSRTADT